MQVLIERTNEEKGITFEGTVAGLLKMLGLNPETVIISRNGELLIGNDNIRDADHIKIHSVISGG